MPLAVRPTPCANSSHTTANVMGIARRVCKMTLM